MVTQSKAARDLTAAEQWELEKATTKLYNADGSPIDVEATVLDPDWVEWLMGDDEEEETTPDKDEDAMQAVLAALAGEQQTAPPAGVVANQQPPAMTFSSPRQEMQYWEAVEHSLEEGQ